jgi:predicted ribosomally synthesized peptide with nif11-like leader
VLAAGAVDIKNLTAGKTARAQSTQRSIIMGKAREFYEALAKDEAMQERAKGLKVTAETTGEAAVEAAIEAAVAFAQSEGYTFTPGELKDFSKELSDQELAAVAGGYDIDTKMDICFLGGNVANCVCPFIGYSSFDGLTFVCVGFGQSNY